MQGLFVLALLTLSLFEAALLTTPAPHKYQMRASIVWIAAQVLPEWEAAVKITHKVEEDNMTKENGALHDIVRRNMKKRRKKCYLIMDIEGQGPVLHSPGTEAHVPRHKASKPEMPGTIDK